MIVYISVEFLFMGAKNSFLCNLTLILLFSVYFIYAMTYFRKSMIWVLKNRLYISQVKNSDCI